MVYSESKGELEKNRGKNANTKYNKRKCHFLVGTDIHERY